MGQDNLQLLPPASNAPSFRGTSHSPRHGVHRGPSPHPITRRRYLQMAKTSMVYNPSVSPYSDPSTLRSSGCLTDLGPQAASSRHTWFSIFQSHSHQTHTTCSTAILPPERPPDQKWFPGQIPRMPVAAPPPQGNRPGMLMDHPHWSPSLEGGNKGDRSPGTATHWPLIMENV